MANETLSPNMSMPIPGVGLTDGPQWASDLNASLNILDSHDHTPGYGVPITVAGLNINADLPIGANNITGVRSLRMNVQAAPLATASDLGCVYVSGVDLYYNDELGNQIQITQSGGLAGTPGSISNLVAPASAAWVSADATFVWSTSPAVAAAMDAGTLIIRYPGSYPTPSGNYIALQAPAALATGYALKLPPALPLASGAALTASTAGVLGYTNVDNSTIAITANQYVVQASGLVDGRSTAAVAGKIAAQGTHQWQLNGNYANVGAATEIDGYLFFPVNATITAIWIYNAVAGTGGTTEIDILKASAPAGAFSTILTTTGKITSAAAAGVWTDNGSIVAAQTGVTKPVMSSANVSAGDALRFDTISTMTGSPRDCGVVIQYVPR